MVSTTANTRGDGFDAFAEAVLAAYLPPVALATDDVTAFRGGIRSTAMGTIQLARIHVGNEVAVRRTNKLIACSAFEFLKVGVQLTGSCVVSQGDRQALVNPGDYVIYDTARPYQLLTRGQFQMQTVIFPRNLLRLSTSQLSQLTARPISGHTGLGSMMSSFVVELGKKSTGEFGGATTHLADAIMDMLAASFVEQLPEPSAWDLHGDKRSLLLRVRAFIEGQLDDPDLDIATIAAAQHVSVRYLQKLFEQERHTVTGWIRDRRIEHCRRDLANPALADMPVQAIAARWGLVNAAHFSRLFKATVGEAPRDYRTRALNAGRATASESG
jgi:AraC-like DNA-binding protein